MATRPGVNQGKTKFVEEQLEKDPTARAEAINEAWKSEGHEDSISDSLVNKTRSRLRLTGKRGDDRGEPSAAKGKAQSPKGASKAAEAASQANGRGEGPGSNKSAFVEDALRRDPKANVAAINREWAGAGHEGSISDSVFYKIKREMDEIGGRSSAERKPESPKAIAQVGKETPPTSGRESASAARSVSPSREIDERVVDEVEAGIDDLMFLLKLNGGRPEVEEALRAARRLLTRPAGE